MPKHSYPETGLEIAIIGMSVRVPGAETLDAFWQNLAEGKESVRFFSDSELDAAGIKKELYTDPNYVPAKGLLENGMAFEAGFFGFSNREAELMDPQLRIYLETSYQALANSGYQADAFGGKVGIYGGAGSNPYWTSQFLQGHTESLAINYEASNLNGQEFFNTRVAHSLDLRGPAITVQTACSSSLVAVHLAVQGLIAGDCDIALAGGVEMSTDSLQSQPDVQGYIYQEGMIYSQDGHCRPFDKSAGGTVPGDGAAMVVLKRLSEAVSDGDHIYAVIKGSAVNNDGAIKAGFTAPNVNGQVAVIAAALEMAEVDPETLGYIEAHGTGTKLGDPIEIRALTQAFGTELRNYCGIGSVKSNLGHLGAAAGVVGLIKTALAIHRDQLPPSINYQESSAEMSFAQSPFYVVDQLRAWPNDEWPHRAGVSSFGIGGTNAHVILEQYCGATVQTAAGPDGELICLSASNNDALNLSIEKLAEQLTNKPNLSIADIAFSLDRGRKHLAYRAACVVDSASALLENLPKLSRGKAAKARTVFMFPGQGSQYTNMGRQLYRDNAEFRGSIDELFAVIPDADQQALLNAWHSSDEINDTQYTQPLLFAVSYALAKWLMSKDVQPTAMIGHSLGEWVAATVAGVFSPAQAMALVCLRGKLMASSASGAMLAVAVSETQLDALLPDGLSIAAVNAPTSCVVSGERSATDALLDVLSQQGISAKYLASRHAFHSAAMEPLLNSFAGAVSATQLNPPRIPFISNVTGTWITEQEATSPEYWARHIRQCVRFSDGIERLIEKDCCFVEVGPRTVLSGLVKQHKTNSQMVSTLNIPANGELNENSLLKKTLADLYVSGIKPRLNSSAAANKGNRVVLPEYPFTRQLFLPTNVSNNRPLLADRQVHGVKLSRHDWNRQAWQNASLEDLKVDLPAGKTWLVLSFREAQSQYLVARLKELGQQVIEVEAASKFQRVCAGHYQINPGQAADYVDVFKELSNLQSLPDYLVHTLNCQPVTVTDDNEQQALDFAFYSFIYICQAYNQLRLKHNTRLIAVSTNVQDIVGVEKTEPVKATLLGAIRVIRQENSHFETQHIDLNLPATSHNMLADALLSETCRKQYEQVVAYRGHYRWVRSFSLIDRHDSASQTFNTRLQLNHIVITGGTGGIGLTLAKRLSQVKGTKLTLLCRTPFPEQDLWPSLLAAADTPFSLKNAIKQILAIKDEGASIQLITADVSQRADLASALSVAKHKFGPIQGLLHCAGVPSGGAIFGKSKVEMSAVLAAKVTGTRLLAECLKDQPLQFVGLMSSITSLLGGFGQVDYCAANAFLDACPSSELFQHSAQVITFNWEAWREVGMALHAHNPAMNSHSVHPILGELTREQDGRFEFTSYLSARSCWLLSEHRVLDKPTLPGSAYLDVALHAAQVIGAAACELQDVYFMAPLSLHDMAWCELKTHLEELEQGYRFTVESRLTGKGEYVKHATGKLVKSSSIPAQKPTLDLQQIISHCQQKVVLNVKGRIAELDADNRELTTYAAIKTGPHWDVFDEVYYGDGQGLAKLSLTKEYTSELDLFKLHPVLIDCATAFLASVYQNAVYIPLFYQQVRQFRPLEANCFSWVKLVSAAESEQENLRFDIELRALNGDILLCVDGFEMKRIAPDDAIAIESVEIPEVELKGLSNEEAITAFEHAVASFERTVVVTHLDVAQEVLRYRESENLRDEPDAVRVLQPRPELSTAFVAAKSATEQKIASIWRSILSLEKVGVLDNFFDLGGDSLVLMQIHSQLNDTFNETKLAIADLYNYPTIKTMAEFIDNSSSSNLAEQDHVAQRVAQMKSARQRRRHNVR